MQNTGRFGRPTGATDYRYLVGFKRDRRGAIIFSAPSFVTRLGAPFERTGTTIRCMKSPLRLGLAIWRGGLGTFAAANAGMMLVHMFATISFYLVCRRFRWCRRWSAIGAIVFGLQYYISFRGQGHLLLSPIYTLPMAISAIWLLFGSKRIGAGSGNRRWCIAVSFLMGVSSPYFLNIYLQLLLIGAVLHWLVHHRRNSLVARISFVVSAVGFIVAHNGTLLIRFLSGPKSSALARKVFVAEEYALLPIEPFVPPFDHRWDPLGAIGRKMIHPWLSTSCVTRTEKVRTHPRTRSRSLPRRADLASPGLRSN